MKWEIRPWYDAHGTIGGIQALIPNAKMAILTVPNVTTMQLHAWAKAQKIGGNEKLKPLAAQLKTANYNFTFPDASPTKLIRRGALICLPRPGQCSFFMVQPDLITSID